MEASHSRAAPGLCLGLTGDLDRKTYSTLKALAACNSGMCHDIQPREKRNSLWTPRQVFSYLSFQGWGEGGYTH